MIVHPDPEVAATLLRGHPDFKVLRRFQPRERYYYPSQAETALKRGLYVDCETTGLDVTRDQIIELAILPFDYYDDGRVIGVSSGLSYFNDPGMPIPPEVVALTGITDDMVKGQRIDLPSVNETVRSASLVIAHHAEFDRPIIERQVPAFERVPWACSYREVPWVAFRTTGAKLVHLLADTCGEFYDAHRALDDCRVGLHILATAWADDRTALGHLLDSSVQPTTRVWAVDSPYSAKDRLKARGYRWSDGTTGLYKAWYRDIGQDAVRAEGQWLHENAGVYRPVCIDITARDRYSERVR